MKRAATPADHSWFVEQMGLTAEADGLPRIAGRVFGFLFLADAPCSLDELAAELGVSKASVSTDARLLLERRLVERVSQPGDRRDYYQVAPDFVHRLIEYRIARWSALRDLTSTYRRRAGRMPPAVAQRLDYVAAAHDHIARQLATALEQLDDRNAAPPETL